MNRLNRAITARPASKLILNGSNLTTSNLISASQVGINSAQWKKIDDCQNLVKKYASGETIIYGINTSCGSFVDRALPLSQLFHFQKNLITSVATQVGEHAPDAWVKSAMIARLNSLCRGFSGLTRDNINVLIAMINNDIIPIVPIKGSLGASGDLGPLSCIALSCIGEWQVKYKGKIMPSIEAFNQIGIKPMILGPKEGLAMINGTSMMLSVASYACEYSKITMLTSDIIAALSMEALQSHITAYDARVHRLKYHPGQYAVAKNIRKILHGSHDIVDDLQVSTQLANENKSFLNEKTENASLQMSAPIEDAYSLRCHAQYMGPSRETLVNAGITIDRELNSTNDNPVLINDENNGNGMFIHNGHFHGQYISTVMDNLKLGIQSVGIISDRRIDRFLDDSHSNKLPSLLVPSKQYQGIRMGFMGGQFMTASLVAENRTLSIPASIQSIPTTADFQDVVSFGLIGGRQAVEVINNINYILAFEAICAAQAIDIREHGIENMSPATHVVYDIIRSRLFKDEKNNPNDILLMPYLETIAQDIADGTILREVEDALGCNLQLIDNEPTNWSWAPEITINKWPKQDDPKCWESITSTTRDLENNDQNTNDKKTRMEKLSQYKEQFKKTFWKSSQLYEKACDSLAAGNTKALALIDPFPIAMSHGKGCIVTTVDGIELNDFQSAYGGTIHGHCHAQIDKAVTEQMCKGTLFGGAISELQVDLAKTICDRIPCMERVRFCNSGTEATLNAVKLARYHTKRDKILMFKGGYHGTLGELTFAEDGALSRGIPQRMKKDIILCDYNDINQTIKSICNHSNELACVIMEPMFGAGGLIKANKEFLKTIEKYCKLNNILLIMDEVTTLRCYYHSMSHELYDIKPDLMTLGKIIGGGYPIGCFGGKYDIMKHCENNQYYHSGSFNGNSISMVAGIETLKLYDQQAVNKVRNLGEKLANLMKNAINKNNIKNIQILNEGPIVHIHFQDINKAILNFDDIPYNQENIDKYHQLYFALLLKGFYTTPRGMYFVSTAHNDDDIEKFASAFEQCLQQCSF